MGAFEMVGSKVTFIKEQMQDCSKSTVNTLIMNIIDDCLA